MLNSLYYRKNLVVDKQKAYQASHKPIWMRPPRSGLYVGVFKGLFAVGMAGTAWSAYSLIRGKSA